LILETATSTLLAPYDLESRSLERVFGTLRAHRVDYADLYFQYSRYEGWNLEEGIVKAGSFNIEQGVGVRAISGDKTAFAYSDEISYEALEDAAKATRAIASAGQTRTVKSNKGSLPAPLYRAIDPVASLQSAEKVALLEKLEKKCRALDPRVTQVMASLGGEYEVVLIARADGTLPGRRGSLTVDDEGNPTRRNVLIEDGVLRGYMQDSLNARLMKMPITGNARRESFAHLTLPRMTNTYMLAGPHEPQEIIASVGRGLYATNFGGGQVDITNGKFVFSTAEAYLIENGKVTVPVKGATLIGNGPDALTRVTMIGNDMKLDSGIGVCGKEGQSVPVGVGQPTLKIEGLTVGGTA
jgi:predicted Zn-dependent protease